MHPQYPPLPPDMERANTCCFTGHRHLPPDQLTAIVSDVESVLRELVGAGYRYFLCGGALGFDMLAEEILLRAAKYNPAIQLILALPCRNQTEVWTKRGDHLDELRRYQQIKGKASAIVYLSDFYTPTCMKERNQFMVDHASCCIAYYNGTPRSGAGQTVRMAEKAGIPIKNVYRSQPSLCFQKNFTIKEDEET